MAALQSFPKPLSAKEEQEYIRRYENGDMEARKILIERNLRLVAYLVKKYNNSEHSQEDLISIGTIGLIKAIASCDTTLWLNWGKSGQSGFLTGMRYDLCIV